MRPRILLYFGCLTLLIALHAPYLRLPFHWDELGQFVPAALDLYRHGSWITTTAEPNVHPPGVMALLAMVWSFTGYSILISRLTMLALAALGVYLAFLLAIRLGRGAPGAPAFAATMFLVAAPMFYTQSMMVLLDMPAMVFTLAALLLFYDGRYAAAAAASTVLVLVKETGITTPLVLAVWLWIGMGDGKPRRREALYFLAPAVALGLWLMVLHHGTGSWFGNANFARYNVSDSLTPRHVVYAIARRIHTLFFEDGNWIGSVALAFSWRYLRTPDWRLAGWVAMAQIVVVTLLGGAVLDRYLLPVLPILYAAFAVAIAALATPWRVTASVGLTILLILGWFVNSPLPVPMESNLAIADFVFLQREAARYLEANFSHNAVVTPWPLSVALQDPDYGYVDRRLMARSLVGTNASDLDRAGITDRDVVVLYSKGGPEQAWLSGLSWMRPVLARFDGVGPQITAADLAARGFEPRMRWTKGAHWIEVYVNRPAPGLPDPDIAGPPQDHALIGHSASH